MRLSELASGERSPVEAFIDAAVMAAGATESLPWMLSYAPVASMNPFQRILYSRAGENGFQVVPCTSLEQAGCVNWKGRSVIHLHWLASVLRGATSAWETEVRLREFDNRLAMWRAAGHYLVWSLHNVLPHDCVDREAEIRLREILCNRVDLIHALSLASVDEAKQIFSVDDSKVFHVGHPSYEGWYANLHDPSAARLDLGVPHDAFVFLQFGSMQPYKGTLELISSFNELCQRNPTRRMRLVIAGKPVDRDYAQAIQESSASNSSIRVIQSSMEEREVQTLFNAADVAVAPYTKTLNSGVALLAATFDKPLIAPAIGGLLETYRESPDLLYVPGHADGLLESMQKAISEPLDAGRVREIRMRHEPRRISSEFFSKMKERFEAKQ